MSSEGKWSVAIAGECLVTRRFAIHREPEFTAVRQMFLDADLTYAHLEMNFGDPRTVGYPARGDWYGSYMLADPAIAHDLRWLGIDIMSLANNHSLDFGERGLRSTISACRDAGLACAGTGQDLDDARAPAFLDTPRGRVALVSVSSGNTKNEWASRPKETLLGRPGINPLRVNTTYEVDASTAAHLQEAARRLGVLKTSAQSNKVGKAGRRLEVDEFQIITPGAQSSAGDGVFRIGDTFKIHTECQPRDLDGNLRSITAAANMADLVLVAHHFNISEGSRGDTPPAFVREFAHRAIDAGADMYLGHGWHKTLGIEIYKGKPIFYGLGNFFAQSEFLERVPYDSYETWGHDIDRLPTLSPDAHPLHPGLEEPSPTWWSSAAITIEINAAGQVDEIELRPVELGREPTPEAKLTRGTGKGSHALTEGRPLLATGENGRRILERLRTLSAGFGTEIEVSDSTGRIRPE